MTSNATPDCNGTTTTERRRDRVRQRVLLAGKIVPADGVVLDCAIRNLSEHGAQIRIGPAQWIPSEFYLIEITAGVAHQAQVSWRTGSLAGLRLSDHVDLDHPGAALLARLRQIWLECAPK
jgi:hypothetical protein